MVRLLRGALHQAHKFFGYKTLVDTSWRTVSPDDEEKLEPSSVNEKAQSATFAF